MKPMTGWGKGTDPRLIKGAAKGALNRVKTLRSKKVKVSLATGWPDETPAGMAERQIVPRRD
jgi:hypothetical protein